MVARVRRWFRAGSWGALWLTAGCYTGLSDFAGPGPAPEDEPHSVPRQPVDPTDDMEATMVPISGLRRLTAAEYDATVADLLDDDELPSFELLPADARTPFDNDYREQTVSDALINAADYLSELAATRLVDDPARRDRVVGCTPAGPDDEACMRSFVESFGRRALRRPLDPAEVELYLEGSGAGDGALAHALEDDDFYTGVELVVRTMLQEPGFLYRVELGEPVPEQAGLFHLDPFEIATRMSYLVWGTGPDDELLDRAAAGELQTPAEREATLLHMLEDPRAQARMERFHLQWLGFEQLPHGGELAAAMRTETAALLRRVLFEEARPWRELLTFPETFVGDALATHYGLTAPGSVEPVWIDYGNSGRRGLLSHGAFLSIGMLADDTSPVLRGKVIRERLLCQEIPPPPPGVNVDEPPKSASDGFCKPDRYAQHSDGGCAGCHQLLEPVGFGLETYDALGRLRTHEVDDPMTEPDESTCAIDGQGELVGVGRFEGPAELAELALQDGLVDQCLMIQLHRFAIGRGTLDHGGADGAVLERIAERVGTEDFTLADVLSALVVDETFAYRREDTFEMDGGM
jgi:Protein of unknown function (DUF1592)/Protein of unknown function (DUF1588)/Protein of unknown function (DUF1595)/Protein of unknown function (DUF1587)